MASAASVVPFTFTAPQAALDDLKLRLSRTRWPDRETVNDWSQGAPLSQLRSFVDYWQNDYDWRRFENVLHEFPQFRTEIDGLGIHFLHVRSAHANALPIVLTHGWPGSVIEFLKLIRPLTDPTAHGGAPEDAFHVILPSLPGFAFSDKPTERGWNVDRVAHAWAQLIGRLGYSRWVAQGGDWGAMISTRLAQQHAAGLIGIHLNYPPVFPDPVPTSGLSDEERSAVAEWQRFKQQEFAYYHLQSTRPQTVGYVLTDSPVAQAAWLFEKFHAWTDRNEGDVSALTFDEMLDEITLYWLTNTAASSARMYFENAGGQPNLGLVELPVGCSIFPREKPRIQRKWAERCYPNLIHWHELDRGGHFAAFEQPVAFVRELRDCFRGLR